MIRRSHEVRVVDVRPHPEVPPLRRAYTLQAAIAAVRAESVILDPAGYDLWLDPGMQNVTAVSELLKPYDARLMRCHPVSSRVNHVGNDDEECSAPVELAEIQDRLFR
jgi:hypothetical protein